MLKIEYEIQIADLKSENDRLLAQIEYNKNRIHNLEPHVETLTNCDPGLLRILDHLSERLNALEEKLK